MRQGHGKKTAGCYGVHSLTFWGNVKSSGRKILSVHQFEVWYDNAARPCHFVVVKFLQSHIQRVVGMTEFHQPMAIAVRKHSLWAASATIAAFVQKKFCIGVLLLFQHFKSFSL